MSIIVCTGAPFNHFISRKDRYIGGSGYRENRICKVTVDFINSSDESVLWPKSDQKNIITTNGIYKFACRLATEKEIKEYEKHGDHILKPTIQERIKKLRI
jgi:hypothetical protein